MDPVSSTTFIRSPSSPARKEALFVAKDILLNRLFLGNYVERRYVGQIKDYRDVVTISTAETELIADLDKIRQNINRDCSVKWIGITGPEFDNVSTGHCLWVKFTNIPFGRFWFQIKQIKCEDEEIIVGLKCIRSALVEDYGCVTKEGEILQSTTKKCKEKSSDNVPQFDYYEKLTTFYMFLNEAVAKVRPHLTLQNFVTVSKFLTAMTIMLLTALITCIQYLGEYLLKLIRELSLFLKAISPILISLMECITKVIGGLFILIALLFRKQLTMGGEQLPPRQKFPSLMQDADSSTFVPSNRRERNRVFIVKHQA